MSKLKDGTVNNKKKQKFCGQCREWVPFSRWKIDREQHKAEKQYVGETNKTMLDPSAAAYYNTQQENRKLQEKLARLGRENETLRNALRVLGTVFQAIFD